MRPDPIRRGVPVPRDDPGRTTKRGNLREELQPEGGLSGFDVSGSHWPAIDVEDVEGSTPCPGCDMGPSTL